MTGLTDREGLLVNADVLDRGRGVMEMLGCWFVLVLLAEGVLELWIVNPLVFTKPGSKLIELVQAFFNFSTALAPADWFLETFEGKTDIEDPCPCNSWKDFAIAYKAHEKNIYREISNKTSSWSSFYLINLIVGDTIRGRI